MAPSHHRHYFSGSSEFELGAKVCDAFAPGPNSTHWRTILVDVHVEHALSLRIGSVRTLYLRWERPHTVSSENLVWTSPPGESSPDLSKGPVIVRSRAMALTTEIAALRSDAAPQIHLTPVDVLQDELRMKRLKASLGDGIFAYASENAASRILGECLKICGGSSETLSEVLQIKFFLEHTPFHWILANRPFSKPGAPPLLVQLLSVCDQLDQSTQEDIMAIMSMKYDSGSYIAVKPKLPAVKTHESFNLSFFQGEDDCPSVSSKLMGPSRTGVSFQIPKFFDRLSIDGEVWLLFMAQGDRFCFKAFINNLKSDLTQQSREVVQFELKGTRTSPVQQLTRSVSLQLHAIGQQPGQYTVIVLLNDAITELGEEEDGLNTPSMFLTIQQYQYEGLCVLGKGHTVGELYMYAPFTYFDFTSDLQSLIR
ncbi:hypothetical protein NMY22_g17792 [Coprinellus aureogranulatus]|nr:hypothetical protein NMY22_g17792 [Coprinellus aureogranulatus]